VDKKSYLGLSLLFVICGVSLPSLSGLLVIPLPIESSGLTISYALVLSMLFLSATLILKSHKLWHGYWQIFYAFFIASLAIFFDLLINISSGTKNGLLSDILVSTLIIVGTITLFTKVSGNSLSSIFIKKGNLKSGLVFGLCGFLFFALTSIPAAQHLFQGKDLSLNKVFAWLPWIVPIVFLNGVREETLYRGLFLKKFESKLGPKTSNLIQAIFFALSHSVAGVGFSSYTTYVWILVTITFSLGLIWGYMMQRTDSLLGSVVFHAGTDIPVFIGILSNISGY
jgi:membrane protease YdiL (CAAX protease family)